MLYFVLSWGLLAGVSTSLGALLLVDLAIDQPDRPIDRLLIATWLGLGIVALVLLTVSFVTPLTPLIGWALVLTLAVRSLLQGKLLRGAIGEIVLSRRSLFAGMLVLLGIAFWLDRPVTWQDTGYYHASLVQWLETYGTVPGLSLIFQNLGFTSAWFALAAPLNPSGLKGAGLGVTNGFAFVLLVVQWAIGMNAVLRQRARVADRFSVIWGSLMIPIVLFLNPMAEILRSPSPDLPVTLVVGVIAWVMLLIGEPSPGGDRELSNDRMVPVLLAVIAVSFKLIALPLLPITVGFALWRSRSSRSRFWTSVGGVGSLAIGGLLPLMVGNVMTSGCPLYPGNVLCLDLPWSPTKTSIAAAAMVTHGWTSWYGTPPPGMHPWIWAVSQWWSTSTKEKITAIGVLLAAILGSFVVFKMLVPKGRRMSFKLIAQQLDEQPLVWVAIVGLGGLGFVMSMSPFFRFSLPYIVLLLTVGVLGVFQVLRRDFSMGLNAKFSNFVVNAQDLPSRPIVLGGLGLLVMVMVLHRSTLLLPPAMVYRSTWVDRITNDIRYIAPRSGDVKEETVVQKDMCWNAPLPCAYEVPHWVHLRSPDRGIAGGFIRK